MCSWQNVSRYYLTKCILFFLNHGIGSSLTKIQWTAPRKVCWRKSGLIQGLCWSKAFDAMNRETLGIICEKLKCSKWLFIKKIEAELNVSGNLINSFKVENSAKQTISLTLFCFQSVSQCWWLILCIVVWLEWKFDITLHVNFSFF